MKRVLLVVLALVMALALTTRCARDRDPWVRTDLLRTDARVDRLSPGTRLEGSSVRVEVPLSSRPDDPRGAAPSRVRGLRIPPGVRVAFRVEVASSAFLSFIPLRPGDGSCVYRYRVAIRTPGSAETEIFNIVPRTDGEEAPATATVDLSRWEGQSAELLLQADAEGNCAAADALTPPVWGSPAVYGRAPRERERTTDARPNVILISFDAMRFDAIGPRGSQPTLTPALDRFAAKSEVWTAAFSVFNVTNPSFASTMTGLYGKHHGIYELGDPLPYSFTTLAEVLRGAGYHTGAVVSAQHLSDTTSGLGQGFEDYIVARNRFGAEMAADEAMDWLDEARGPFFFWLHFFDPHTPHDAPTPYAAGFRPAAPTGMEPTREWVPFRKTGHVEYADPMLRADESLYDAEVAYLDRQVDRLLDYLDGRGLLETSIVIVMSDHGENRFADRVPFRHAGLWDATTHIPLIIHRPGGKHRVHHYVHKDLVETVDLFPSVLSMVGVQAPPSDGRSFVDGLAPRTVVFAEHAHRSGAMVRDPDYIYSWTRGNPFLADGEFLFDVRRDPRQQTNLAYSRRDLVAKYGAMLAAWGRD